jgi:hypothetical protein
MPGLVVRSALQSQLHDIAISLAVGPRGLRAARLALKQTRILDRVAQTMFDNRVVPINEGFQIREPL